MPKKLYTVTVEHDFVFASDHDDSARVLDEFDAALRRDLSMRDELDDASVSATPLRLGHGLPGNYRREDRPWGVDDDTTIGELLGPEPVCAQCGSRAVIYRGLESWLCLACKHAWPGEAQP